MPETVEGALRVWHISNPPRSPFWVPVQSVEEAKRVICLLASYDLYLDDLIEANGAGLEIFEEGEWFEWHDLENDDDIMTLMYRENTDGT